MISVPFIIVHTGRTGSSLLCSLLDSTGKVGHVNEHLNKIFDKESLYENDEILSGFDQCYKYSCNMPNSSGKWGIKCNNYYLFFLKRFLDIRGAKMADAKWIYVKRRNSLLQAASLKTAEKTQVWYMKKGDDRQSPTIDISHEELLAHTGRVVRDGLVLDSFFDQNHIVPHTIYYEDFRDEHRWSETVASVFDFLGVDYQSPIKVSTDLVKQTKEINSRYVSHIRGYISRRRIPVTLDGDLA